MVRTSPPESSQGDACVVSKPAPQGGYSKRTPAESRRVGRMPRKMRLLLYRRHDDRRRRLTNDKDEDKDDDDDSKDDDDGNRKED